MYVLKCSCRVFEHPHKSAICPFCHHIGVIPPLTDGAFEHMDAEPVKPDLIEEIDVMGVEPKKKVKKIKTF